MQKSYQQDKRMFYTESKKTFLSRSSLLSPTLCQHFHAAERKHARKLWSEFLKVLSGIVSGASISLVRLITFFVSRFSRAYPLSQTVFSTTDFIKWIRKGIVAVAGFVNENSIPFFIIQRTCTSVLTSLRYLRNMSVTYNDNIWNRLLKSYGEYQRDLFS